MLRIVRVICLWPHPRSASLKKEKLEGAPGSNLMFLCTKIFKREFPPWKGKRVFPEEVHLPRQQQWVGICILIHTLSEGSTARKNKTERSSRKQPCVFVWTNIFNLSFLLEMMKSWQARLKKAPNKGKGEKEVQRGRTQVRARKDLGKQPYVLYGQTFKNLRFSSFTR